MNTNQKINQKIEIGFIFIILMSETGVLSTNPTFFFSHDNYISLNNESSNLIEWHELFRTQFNLIVICIDSLSLFHYSNPIYAPGAGTHHTLKFLCPRRSNDFSNNANGMLVGMTSMCKVLPVEK